MTKPDQEIKLRDAFMWFQLLVELLVVVFNFEVSYKALFTIVYEVTNDSIFCELKIT